MVKKKVPDWLNSSLWSTTPSPADDDRLHRYSPKPSSTTASESPIDPPLPPAATRDEPPPLHPPKLEIKDKNSRNSVINSNITSNNNDNNHINKDDDNNNGTAVASASVEDISRQAQLLTEVRNYFPLSLPFFG